eukprot:g63279.t1
MLIVRKSIQFTCSCSIHDIGRRRYPSNRWASFPRSLRSTSAKNVGINSKKTNSKYMKNTWIFTTHDHLLQSRISTAP